MPWLGPEPLRKSRPGPRDRRDRERLEPHNRRGLIFPEGGLRPKKDRSLTRNVEVRKNPVFENGGFLTNITFWANLRWFSLDFTSMRGG